MSKAEGDTWEAGESSDPRDRGEASGGVSRELTLYLFGRTGREKEDWFQRFLSASKLKADLRKASFAAGTKTGEQHARLLLQLVLYFNCGYLAQLVVVVYLLARFLR